MSPRFLSDRILRSISTLGSFCAICCLLPKAAAQELDFDREVRPILSENCFACHGPDEHAREGDLRLDTAQGATADVGGHVAIKPGDPESSMLVLRIESEEEDEVMPPTASELTLSDADKQTLRRWISEGARYDLHWSFAKPVRTRLSGDSSVHPIDALVIAKLDAAELARSERANRYQLIRRLTLDLIGLPPTIDEADAFVADDSDDAFEKVVDRLLLSDSFGEHWARMWLDLARYADTRGYEKDNPREIWRYRDWVIEALNADMPYDQFTIEQLAGDLLPKPTAHQKLATAFHRNTLTNEEGGTDDEEFRTLAVKDRVDTTIQVWMGLTMGCAKCHSHKYDPISQKEYYRFFAYFNQTADNDREAPLMDSPTNTQIAETMFRQMRVTELRKELGAGVAGFDSAYKKWSLEKTEKSDWTPLRLLEFQSEQNIGLDQTEDRKLVARGTLPDSDTWSATFGTDHLRKITALRLETFPKQPGEGNASDKNQVINELTMDLIREGEDPVPITLINPRADFSQQAWDIAKSIDSDAATGWAVSPKAGEPHVAIFDLSSPIEDLGSVQVRIGIRQTYGSQLVLSRFRVSASDRDPQQLKPVLVTGSREEFQRIFPATRQLLDEIASAEKSLAEVRAAVAKTPVMQELPAEKARETRVHVRGNFLDPGEIVQPGVPAAFGTLGEDAPQNRLGVARWLTSADNPLTARVAVNRIWARLFGIGIVETEEDFGTQGLRPSHPELLDSLAIDFREQGWSLKGLLKTIVMSSTYQQSSVVSEAKLAKDPRNRLLGRGARFRMSAEMIRDQALAASGLLTFKRGGPSVMPPQPDGVWKSTYSDRRWINAEGEDRYRRALYTYWKRTSPYPAMTTFDAGSGEVCLVRRVRTNTPLQALITLNDPSYFEAAGALAIKLKQHGVDHGFRLVLTRPPTDREKNRLESLFAETKIEFAADLAAAAKLVESAGLDRLDASADLAAWVTVANVLLNLDETLAKP